MPLTGRCHCGATAFSVDADMPAKLTRCTCSWCTKTGVLYAYFPPAVFTVEKSADATYRFGKHVVTHFFCTVCGIPTYSDSPDFGQDGHWDGETRKICVNARLFDDFEAADAPVTVVDGRNLW